MITKHFKKFLIAPIVILALGVIFGIVNGGLNLGIDFTGGSIVTIDFQEEFDTAVVQQARDQNGMGDSPIVKSGEGYTQAEIRMRTLDTDELQSTTNNAILEDIKETYPEAEITTVDKVGGVASADLVKNAFLAVAIACGLMLIYIWIRFQLYNGISAVVMLVHDVGIMIAIMCILQIQINSAFIAACLTIIGYSINNTIVIFDRVRDNLKIMNPKRIPRAEIADTSIKETLTRTINTSVTTLIMIVCLYIFGISTIKEFSFPIIVGLLAGVYSSVFLAAPMWSLMADRSDRKKNGAAKTKSKKKTKTAKA
ncbi:protein translocase subunit SecF [Christensenella massiliensis]|uniref:Protein-export membrane protein SecF n=1 Tax=Christensenella massiliensis TaxID=1805714 RepID=A0AAU8A9H3_9FIRM